MAIAPWRVDSQRPSITFRLRPHSVRNKQVLAAASAADTTDRAAWLAYHTANPTVPMSSIRLSRAYSVGEFGNLQLHGSPIVRKLFAVTPANLVVDYRSQDGGRTFVRTLRQTGT